MEIILLSLASLFIAATILPMARSGKWWIRIFDFPRLQIAIGGILVLIFYACFFIGSNAAECVLFLALAASVTYQSYKMYPYTPFSKRQVLDSEKHDQTRIFSILVSNVYRKNRDAERFIQLIRKMSPDIICVLEPDDWWE